MAEDQDAKSEKKSPLWNVFEERSKNPPKRRPPIPPEDSKDQSSVVDNPEDNTARQAATKLAKTENEIAILVKEYDETKSTEDEFYVEIYDDGAFEIALYTDKIKNHLPHVLNDKTEVRLFYSPDDNTDYANLVNIQTHYYLSVGGYTDKKTRDKVIKQSKESLIFTNAEVRFFFNDEGKYRKLQVLDSRLDSERKKLFDTGHVQAFESEMLPEDFELAQTALHLIREQLTPN